MDKEWRPKSKGDEFPEPGKKTKREAPSGTQAKASAPKSTQIFSSDSTTVEESTQETNESSGPSVFKSRLLWIVLGSIVALILIITFLIVPAMKGYAVYKEMQASGVPDQYATDMAALAQAKINAEQLANASALDAAQAKAAQAEQANDIAAYKSASEAKLAQIQESLDMSQKDLHDTQLALVDANAASNTKDNTIAEAARRLCCISRFTNSAINAYAVVDDKVTCVSEGGTPISC